MKNLIGNVILICNLILTLLCPQAFAGSEPIQQPQGVNLTKIRGNDAFLQINSAGTLVAVIQGGQTKNGRYTGNSLEVWSLDSKQNLERVVFADTRHVSFSPTAVWTHNYLLYSTIEGITLQDFERNLPLDPVSISACIKGYIWKEGAVKAESFSPAKEPYMVPSGRQNEIIVLNPIDEEIRSVVDRKLGQGNKQGRNGYTSLGVNVDIYSVEERKKLKRLHVLMPKPSSLSSEFNSLFVSRDGKYLFASTYTNSVWRKKTEPLLMQNFLIRVNLLTGGVSAMTSTEEPDSLWLLDRGPFGLGRPQELKDGKVVCALNASERNLTYRFQYFGEDPQDVTEVRVDDRILKKGGIPRGGIPISWDNSGNVLLQTEKDIWFFETKSFQATLVASNAVVTQLIGRSSTNVFLVRLKVKPVSDSRGPNNLGVKENAVADTLWAFIKSP